MRRLKDRAIKTFVYKQGLGEDESYRSRAKNDLIIFKKRI